MAVHPPQRSTSLSFPTEEYYFNQIETLLKNDDLTQKIIDEAQAIFDEASHLKIWKKQEDDGPLGVSFDSWYQVRRCFKQEARELISKAKAVFNDCVSTSTIVFEKLPVSAFEKVKV